MFIADLVEGCEDGRLDVEILEDGLDHKVRRRVDIFGPDDASNATLDGVDFRRAKDSTLDGFGQKIGDDLLAALDPLRLARGPCVPRPSCLMRHQCCSWKVANQTWTWSAVAEWLHPSPPDS